jgi:hypothetical protein
LGEQHLNSFAKILEVFFAGFIYQQGRISTFQERHWFLGEKV